MQDKWTQTVEDVTEPFSGLVSHGFFFFMRNLTDSINSIHHLDLMYVFISGSCLNTYSALQFTEYY